MLYGRVTMTCAFSVRKMWCRAGGVEREGGGITQNVQDNFRTDVSATNNFGIDKSIKSPSSYLANAAFPLWMLIKITFSGLSEWILRDIDSDLWACTDLFFKVSKRLLLPLSHSSLKVNSSARNSDKNIHANV